MNRYDPNAPRQQGNGGNQGTYDTPRQANQWQADQNRQTGGGWGQEGAQDHGQYTYARDERAGNAGAGDPMGEIRGGRDDQSRQQSDYASLDRSYRSDPRNEWHGGNWQRDRDRDSNRSRSRYADRYYDAGYPADYTPFTSEDFGGRDFSARRSGFAGGFGSSDTYRPSYGLSRGDWTGYRSGNDSSADYGSWRDYGERRGFMERAGDEIASWFGDEDAARRREQDHRGRGPSDYTRSDERICEDVNDQLTHDWRVDASHIRVTVKDGEVTLEGTVDSRNAKRRAEDVAEDVSGVKHVQNNLRVQDASSRSTAMSSGGTTATSTKTT